jgi:hypothetical protein
MWKVKDRGMRMKRSMRAREGRESVKKVQKVRRDEVGERVVLNIARIDRRQPWTN